MVSRRMVSLTSDKDGVKVFESLRIAVVNWILFASSNVSVISATKFVCSLDQSLVVDVRRPRLLVLFGFKASR